MTRTIPDFRRRLLRWYANHRRDLPWRTPLYSSRDCRPDAYAVLVSELMLQQTRVAVVIDYFRRFITRFPTIAALAASDEQEVLRSWQGLGYYSRARHLHHAAKQIAADFGGEIPRDLESLRRLRGIGRYTAGAVASLAFGAAEPVVDGNVARVLCRIDAITDDPRDPTTAEALWRRAAELLPRRGCGDFNSALMELGATVCTPKLPRCLVCPVRENCSAFAAGVVDQIPPPRKRKPNPKRRRFVLVLRRTRDGRFLVEQRPSTGRWASMWQFVTLNGDDGANGAPNWKLLSRQLGQFSRPKPIAQIRHELTHRSYEFEVFAAEITGKTSNSTDADVPPRRWVSLVELTALPLPRPHVMIAGMIKKSDPVKSSHRMQR